MTVLFMAALPSASARADDRPPPSLSPSLIDRAVRADSPGMTASERAFAAAPWIPQLRLGALVEHGDSAAAGRVNTVFYGALMWPLGRRPSVTTSKPRASGAPARSHAIRSSSGSPPLGTRVGSPTTPPMTWPRELAEEEADATLDALTGAATEDEP